MGCDTYEYRDKYIKFNEDDMDVSCLCTFPHNDSKKITVGRLRSLAMLGAAIKLIHEGEDGDSDYFYIPGSLPKWIIDEINLKIPDNE